MLPGITHQARPPVALSQVDHEDTGVTHLTIWPLIGPLTEYLASDWSHHGGGGGQQREEPAGQVSQHQGHEGGGRGLQVSARDSISVHDLIKTQSKGLIKFDCNQNLINVESFS